MKKILLVTLLLSLLSTPSIAEDVAMDSSAWEAESGWAVVDSTGEVSNIIVCTNAVCGNDEFLNTAIQNGAIAPGSTIVRQTVSGGGHWGTYDNNTETFTIDRSCANCEPHKDMHKAGSIKNGVVVQPIIIPGLDEFVLNNPNLTIDEAADLLKDLLQQKFNAFEAMKSSFVTKGMSKVIMKKNKHRIIKLTPNLKQFKKISRTKKTCKIKKNSVLILKSGTCKIDIYKDGKKERVTTKVKK